jgi:von Willebrand factor type A domain
MLAVFGVSFLTPVAALFVLTAAVPLGALLLLERRAERIRRVLSLAAPSSRALAPVILALVLLPALVAVAAAQPVVVRERMVSERADAQAIVLFDTSLSMRASAGPGRPTRLARAKRLALRLQRSLSDVPMGIASMTDRSLPNIMPTTDRTLFERTVDQAIAINQPPPSQQYENGRATSFDALIPLVESHFFAQGVQRRLLVVFTDGESSRISPVLRLTLHRRVTPVFVHVWAQGERIFQHGKVDPNYTSDPTSNRSLDDVAKITGASRAYSESDFGAFSHAARDAVGHAGTRTHVDAYARIALAPWFVLGGIAPLAFLLWRRVF